jgi:hypothetical protein
MLYPLSYGGEKSVGRTPGHDLFANRARKPWQAERRIPEAARTADKAAITKRPCVSLPAGLSVGKRMPGQATI